MKIFFCTIIIICSITMFAEESDTNNDGKIDKWIDINENNLVEIKMDKNYDSMIDYIARYSRRGEKVYEEMDFNFDGVMDDYYYYEKGLLVKREVDSNYDSKIDIWVYLKDGEAILKYERDSDFDGTIDIVKDYKG